MIGFMPYIIKLLVVCRIFVAPIGILIRKFLFVILDVNKMIVLFYLSV